MSRPRRRLAILSLTLGVLAASALASAPDAYAFCSKTLVCRHKGDAKSCHFVQRCTYTYRRKIPRCTWVHRCYKRYYCNSNDRWGQRFCGYRVYCKRYKSCM